ncbi:MAG: hypothetical protein GY774_03130 [Planctomycetes bacterium]|nr:hypothetical protein [Planctomycetota bacterium]
MNKKHFVSALLLSLCISCITLADRQLDRGEILQIFEKLTSQPQKAWLAEGTIEADREEYKAPKTDNTAEINRQITEQIKEYQDNPNKRELSIELQKMKIDAIPFNVRYKLSNKYKMNSKAVVRVDGDKFYWQIDVGSRTDSVWPDSSVAGNFMTDEFNLQYNAKRTFAWDGQKYTLYFQPGNHAIVDTTGKMPHTINGPLTAGVIPWGYGDYAYENLSTAKSSAEEKIINGQTQIHMTIENPDGSGMVFVMDPEKDHAVVSSMINELDTVISIKYGSHQLVGDKWIPTNVSIDRYEAGTNKLLSYDVWSFTSISSETPGPQSFNVEYQADALIEYRSNLTSKNAMYSYSHTIDTEKLLLDRLAFAASEGKLPQNCATAALKYTITKSGKEVTDEQLAQLVSGQNKTTSLYKMKEFVQSQGLYCSAVKLDVEQLKKLQGCEAILHMPEKNHYIVLGDIDDRHVSRIDLTNNKFFYKTEASFFDTDWTDGVALLISNQPINIEGSSVEIADNQLHSIIGGNGWQCDDLIQDSEDSYCDDCGGYYTYYPERWGCEYVGSGYCAHSAYLREVSAECINTPWGCDWGEWTYYFMWACS